MACENFFRLAEAGKYDDVIFHRVIAGFMIQTGDPTGTGRGGESIWKQAFKDECSPGLKFHGAGILAMVRAFARLSAARALTVRAAGQLRKGLERVPVLRDPRPHRVAER